jgi:oligogalacturonide transport system substrate-binding protein
MMKKSCFCLLSIVLLCLAISAAYGGGNKQDTDRNSGSAPNVTLRFSWWGSDPRHQATLQAMDLFCAQNPGVKMEGEYQGYDGYQQKLMTQLAGGMEPDIVQFDYEWIATICAQGNPFLDFNKEPVDLSGFNTTILKDFCTNSAGELMGMPAGMNAYTIVGSRKFLAKHNIPEDTVWTWENVLEIGTRVHKQNPNDYLFSMPSANVDEQLFARYLLNKTGRHWATADNKRIQVTEAEVADAFRIMYQLFNNGALQPLGDASLFAGLQDQNPKWSSVELGLGIEAAANVIKYKPVVGGEEYLMVSNFPLVANGVNKETYVKPSVIFGVSKRSPNKELGVKFVDFVMNNPDAIRALTVQRGIPCNSRGVELLDKEGLIDPFMVGALEKNSANPMPIPPQIMYNTEIRDTVMDLCEGVAYGNIRPEDAAKRFMTEIKAKMDSVQATYQ